jgi:hypothetical protein
MPIVPVTDMRVHRKDLVLSTQGRSFWILDDISPLHELDERLAQQEAHLFDPRPAYKVNDSGGGGLSELAPEGKPSGATMYYYLRDTANQELMVEIVDQDARVVRVFTNDKKKAKQHKTSPLPNETGMHRMTWDLTYEGPTFVDDAIIWGYTGGVKAPPGMYDVRLLVDGESVATQQVEVKEDPRIESDFTDEDYQEQLALGLKLRDAITEVHEKIAEIQSVKKQIKWLSEQAADDEEVQELATSLLEDLTAEEEKLMQTKNESGQDPIRFAPKLDNQMVEAYNYVTGQDGYISGGREGRPNEAAYTRTDDLEEEWAEVKKEVEATLEESVNKFNEMVKIKNLIGVKRKESKS